MTRLAVVLLLIPFAGACATTRAQIPVERPPLEVPPVPPRVIEPIPPPEPARSEPAGEMPAERTASKARPQPPRDPAKPESKPETAPPVEPPVPTPAQPAAPVVPPLRTGTTDSSEATRQVRDILDRSQSLLDKTDFQRLTPARQALYKNAQMFMKESEDALKAANYDLAKKLADKAETIIKELQSR